MAAGREEGPIYYREIQKNAYLKRIPTESTGSKLRPLGHKKAPLKPMWTIFCVHNGRTPFLEQYPEAESPATLAHKPVWRACLRTARHVTASVKPHVNEEYDFLIDTDNGPVRMLAPDWDTMQDWVTSLRGKLQELKILSGGENVYGAPPVAPPPRAPARDPTSPLPPTPPVPPDRVPGIELTPIARPSIENETQNTQEVQEPVDISNWDSEEPIPSTSQENQPTKSVAKICGQNICLDDSILKRNTSDVVDSDEEFFSEVRSESNDVTYKQTVVVSNSVNEVPGDEISDYQGTNITVIQVSNKGPPHTAIPVLGPDTEIFNFNFKQNVTVNNEPEESFINIVTTEPNNYGTVFDKDYGHLSLTTTVNLTGDNSLYERLCMASTSQENSSPLPVKRFLSKDKQRKSSLPNLESESAYECLFPNSSQVRNGQSSNNQNLNTNSQSQDFNSKAHNVDSHTQNLNRNIDLSSRNASQTQISSDSQINASNAQQNLNSHTQNLSNNQNINMQTQNSNNLNQNVNYQSQTINQINNQLTNTQNLTNGQDITQIAANSNLSSTARVLRSNIERSQSQNAYDSSRLRTPLIRRVQNNSPKREGKCDRLVNQTKPIWKRGLTELNLLSRFRGIGQGKRQDSPTRQETENGQRVLTSPIKVVRRSRPEARVDSARRRSSSLSNGAPLGQAAAPAPPAAAAPPLVSLRQRQAATLRGEQARGAALPATLRLADPPVFTEYDKHLWVAWWGISGTHCSGRSGDRVVALRGQTVSTLAQARHIMKHYPPYTMDMLFHRVPLAKVYVLNKRDRETLGIRLDSECNIVKIEDNSPASRCNMPQGKWALTEVNNRPLNLLKGGDEEMNRLSLRGTEVSILIQPSALVKKMRAAVKGNKTLLSIR